MPSSTAAFRCPVLGVSICSFALGRTGWLHGSVARMDAGQRFADAAVVLLIAFLVAEYGNYQSGKRLQHLCDLTGPHDRTTSAEGTPKAEADAICQNAEADDD